MKFVLIFSALLFLIIIWLVIDFSLGRKKHLMTAGIMETPILHGHFEIFTHGKDFFQHYFLEIRKAKKHVHILYYIVKDDELGREFFALLAEKAREGVEVRLLLDRLGCLKIKKKDIQALRSAGVQFAFSNQVRLPYLFYTAQVRNHRKISIIDGKMGFMGGFNIGKEYIDQDPKLTPWRDYQLKMTGEGVNFLQSEFLLDWKVYSGENLHGRLDYFPKLPKGPVRHQFVPTEAGQLEHHFIRLIQQAEQSITIGTPYFIPSAAVYRELFKALDRGVGLTVIVPYTADHVLVQEASFRYLRKLIMAGAMVHQYKNGFYHAKALLIDQKLCDIGTANFDKRSLFLNKEINCFIYDPAFMERVRAVITKDILDSEPMSMKELMEPKPFRLMKEALAGMISYFL